MQRKSYRGFDIFEREANRKHSSLATPCKSTDSAIKKERNNVSYIEGTLQLSFVVAFAATGFRSTHTLRVNLYVWSIALIRVRIPGMVSIHFKSKLFFAVPWSVLCCNKATSPNRRTAVIVFCPPPSSHSELRAGGRSAQPGGGLGLVQLRPASGKPIRGCYFSKSPFRLFSEFSPMFLLSFLSLHLAACPETSPFGSGW